MVDLINWLSVDAACAAAYAGYVTVGLTSWILVLNLLRHVARKKAQAIEVEKTKKNLEKLISIIGIESVRQLHKDRPDEICIVQTQEELGEPYHYFWIKGRGAKLNRLTLIGWIKKVKQDDSKYGSYIVMDCLSDLLCDPLLDELLEPIST